MVPGHVQSRFQRNPRATPKDGDSLLARVLSCLATGGRLCDIVEIIQDNPYERHLQTASTIEESFVIGKGSSSHPHPSPEATSSSPFLRTVIQQSIFLARELEAMRHIAEQTCMNRLLQFGLAAKSSEDNCTSGLTTEFCIDIINSKFSLRNGESFFVVLAEGEREETLSALKSVHPCWYPMGASQFLSFVSKQNSENIMRKLHTAAEICAKREGVAIRVGVSNETTLQEVPIAFREARIALSIARSTRRFLIRSIKLRTLSLLLETVDEAAKSKATEFWRNVMGRFESYTGKLPRQDLEDTLWVWLQCKCDAKEASKQMHIHPNTLRHRLKVIEDVLELDLNDFWTRVDLLIALCLKKTLLLAER